MRFSRAAIESAGFEDMEIFNETQQAVADLRTAGGLLFVKNSVFVKTGTGIGIATTGGPYGATLENVTPSPWPLAAQATMSWNERVVRRQ
jgi:hypothetical protein